MIQKIICLVLLQSTFSIHSMQETIEYKAPLQYIFLNIITLMCPDEKKSATIITNELKKREKLIDLIRLGACSSIEGTDDINKDIKEKLFSFLEKIDIPSSISYCPSTKLYIDDQRIAPPIFCAFCTATTEEDINIIKAHIKEHASKLENPFKNTAKKNDSWYSSWIPSYDSLFSCPDTKFSILLAALNLMFDDTQRNSALELCTKMLSILEHGKNENGNLEIIVTANMAEQCCRNLLKTNELEMFFVDVHASDKAGCLTPQKEFYALLLAKKNIKPEECLVIDEHKENLIGAQQLGMRALHKYKNEEFHDHLKMILSSKKPSEKQ